MVVMKVPPPAAKERVLRPAERKIRRPRSHSTPPPQPVPSDDDGESEDERSESPPVKGKGKDKKSTTKLATQKPPPILKSTRTLVAVPTHERYDPPCAGCARLHKACVKNISGGACCACRKTKRKCNYAKGRPGRGRSTTPVEDPEDSEEEEDDAEDGTVEDVPQPLAARKIRGR